MVQYEVVIDGVTFDELNQVQGSTTINPFGDRFICEFLDNEGNKFEQVSPDNAAEIFARDPTPSNQADNSFSSIFEGYVVQADEGQEGSRDSLEVTIYSFDQIIRNERVSNDQSGNTIATALENIIKTDTPVEYVSGNVSVGDNRTLNRPLQGLTVEEALRVLSLRSVNENYGVNNSREFFFRPRVENPGEKDITDNDVTNYSIPERGKESKNEVTVNYDNDNERITVSNGSNQLNVQDSLDTQDPVAFPDEISRPSITDDQEALAEGREFLRQRENTLAGRVTVVGDTDFLSNDVGDTVNVTITPRGIDDEFVLVGKEVDYVRNEISFDIIQKRGDQDSLLKAIGQQLKREELSETDQGTPSDKVTQTSVRADITQSYSGVTAQSEKVTTTCRNQLREAWLDDEPVEITTAVLGDGDTVLRSDTSVPNQVDTSSVTLATNGSDALDVSFSLTGTGNIVGFRDTDGDLLFIALIDEATDPSGTLTLTINDADTDKSVLTNTGQEAVRDLFRGTTSLIATQAEYGDSGTEPQESDTTISTQVAQQYNDADLLLLTATSDFDEQSSLTSSDRIFTSNDQVRLAQSGYWSPLDDASGGTLIENDVYCSDDRVDTGVARGVGSDQTQQLVVELGAVDYDLPEYEFIYRGGDPENDITTGEVDIKINGNVVETFAEGATLSAGVDWEQITITDVPLNKGDSVQIVIETIVADTNSEDFPFDAIGIVDNDFTYNFDDTVDTEQNLAGPEFYPTNATIDFDEFSPAQAVSNVTLDSDFNNTLNNQSVTVGNGTTNTNLNSETVSASFADATNSLNYSLTLDGYTNDTSTSPTVRDAGQIVNSVSLSGDINVLNKSDVGRADYEVIFPGSTVNGLTLREAGQVNSHGDALTRSIFPDLNPTGENVILSEDLGFDIS